MTLHFSRLKQQKVINKKRPPPPPLEFLFLFPRSDVIGQKISELSPWIQCTGNSVIASRMAEQRPRRDNRSEGQRSKPPGPRASRLYLTSCCVSTMSLERTSACVYLLRCARIIWMKRLTVSLRGGINSSFTPEISSALILLFLVIFGGIFWDISVLFDLLHFSVGNKKIIC